MKVYVMMSWMVWGFFFFSILCIVCSAKSETVPSTGMYHTSKKTATLAQNLASCFVGYVVSSPCNSCRGLFKNGSGQELVEENGSYGYRSHCA